MNSRPSPLEQRLDALLNRRRAECRLRQLKAAPLDSVDFSSNDFLSLSTNPVFRQAYLDEINNSSGQLGSTGSRLLDGNSTYAETLERDIALFHNGPAGLLTNSGFDANVSLFSCLPQAGDIIIYDELIHASVHDGMRQSRAAKCRPFKHNSVSDLHSQLQICLANVPSHHPPPNVFIAVESVYSMDGDLAPLTEIVTLTKDSTLFPAHNAHIIVDEAHATGLYGPQGRGLVSALGLESHIFARLHTFGKALAGSGAIIICSATVRLYLLNYARPLIYTTFLSFPQLAAVKVAYRFLREDQTAALAEHLFTLISTLHSQLTFLPVSPNLAISTECPQSPIFALLSPHPRLLAKHCQDAGFVVRAVVPPTVPEGTERVRVCLHAGNTVDQIVRFVRVVRGWLVAQEGMSTIVSASASVSDGLRDESEQLRAKL